MNINIDANKILGGLAIALLLFISGQVWQAVEIAAENAVRIEHIRETQKDIRGDLDRLWAETSDLARRVE